MKRNIEKYFTRGELWLWFSSLFAITVTFLLFDRSGWLSFIASLIGATSLILCAKGNPIGQALMIIFCIIYALISWRFGYYGELITYACMTLPMAVLSLVSWLRHPFKGRASEVEVNKLCPGEICLMSLLAAAVTVAFYFILAYFNTKSLPLSTFSVTTSFIAVYLTARRSPYFALAYALNDLVLICLWWRAALTSATYTSVLTCFIIFFFNDIYGFISWRRMARRQAIR